MAFFELDTVIDVDQTTNTLVTAVNDREVVYFYDNPLYATRFIRLHSGERLITTQSYANLLASLGAGYFEAPIVDNVFASAETMYSFRIDHLGRITEDSTNGKTLMYFVTGEIKVSTMDFFDMFDLLEQ